MCGRQRDDSSTPMMAYANTQQVGYEKAGQTDGDISQDKK